MATDQATFSVNLEDKVSGTAEKAADALEQLRAQITGGQQAIAQMQAAMKRLSGSTQQVRNEKAALTTKIAAEKAAVTQTTAKLKQEITSRKELAEKTKKLAAEEKERLDKLKTEKQSAFNAALGAAGGPASSLVGKLRALHDVLGKGQSATGIMTVAVAGLATAIAAVTAASIAGAASFLKFLVSGANAARSMQLVREAATQGAQNASNLGTQVVALADKVPLSTAALNELATSLARTRLGGQTIVDTLNLVGQASAAAGDAIGNQLGDIVKRSQLSKRMVLNPMELFGTGLEFDDVAKALSDGMHVSVQAARTALFQGQVPIGEGAKALRTAVEKRFAGINLRKMLSLENIGETFKKQFDKLTSGINLEPLLESLGKIAKAFDQSTVAGSSLKSLATIVGNQLGMDVKNATPLVIQFIKGMIVGAQQLVIWYLQVRIALKKAFTDKGVLGGLDTMNAALVLGKGAAYGIAAAFLLAGAVVATATAQMAALGAAVLAVPAYFENLGESIGAWARTTDWGALGTNIIDGITNGIRAGFKTVLDSVGELTDKVKNKFKSALGIASPSKVFADYGNMTAQGFSKGVDEGAPEAQAAIARMAPAPSGGAAAGAGGAGPITVNVTINVAGGGSPEETAKKLSEPSVLQPIIRAIEESLLGQGVLPRTSLIPGFS